MDVDGEGDGGELTATAAGDMDGGEDGEGCASGEGQGESDPLGLTLRNSHHFAKRQIVQHHVFMHTANTRTCTKRTNDSEYNIPEPHPACSMHFVHEH